MSRVTGLLIALVVLLAPAPIAQAAPTPFGHECDPADGVRHCPTRTLADRIPSFDGVPLDVDVTLPAEGEGPFPAIVMLHGWGGSKTDFQAASPEGRGSATRHYNTNHFARRGYLVVTPTARGFGRSCGSEESRTPDCARGWIRLADQRYEARDVQHLLGLLVDQRLVEPDRIGVTGISYGGGQSLELAYLRDRVRLPDGSFAPWRSPNGTPLRIAAAYPRWLWSDLVYSLLPNGRLLDFETPGAEQSREPIGVPIQTYVSGLFAAGAVTGFYAPPGADPSADLPGWFARVSAGEPYGSDVRAIADEIASHHQGFGIPGEPAPLLLQDGWTDDLFPVGEALRVHRAAGGAPALQFGDLGHARGQNKPNADHHFNDQGTAFLDRHLRGVDGGPPPGSVTAFTQTCPREAPAGGPFTATSWDRLHPGRVIHADDEPRSISSSGGDPGVARALDPIAGAGACATFPDEDAPGTAVLRPPASTGWTLMGRPTVRAAIRTTGGPGQIAARLWDVAPDGRQTLVSRGVYRLTEGQSGDVVFQLNGNGYRYEPGHVPKLELLGQDPPYLRPSNAPFTVAVGALRLELPTLEGSDRAQVRSLRDARPRPRLAVRLRRTGRRAFAVRGRLHPPPGFACEGRVSAQWKAGRRTISNRRADVRRRDCGYALRVRFRAPARFAGHRWLKLTVRYLGSRTLAPVRARPQRVRVR